MTSIKNRLYIALEKSNLLDNIHDLDYMLDLEEQGIDSLGMFTLVLSIQEEFDIVISDDELETFSSLQSIEDYVSKSTETEKSSK